MRIALRRAVAFVAVLAAATGCGGKSHHSGSKKPKQANHTYVVRSSSMEPTLHCARPGAGCRGSVNDRVIAKPGRQVVRGDIVVYNATQGLEVCGRAGTNVKRVLGVPRDRLRERHGFFFVDGKKLDDRKYVPQSERDDTSGSWTVPSHAFFVVGDNRASSCDSRRYGAVLQRYIIGKAVSVERGSRRIPLR